MFPHPTQNKTGAENVGNSTSSAPACEKTAPLYNFEIPGLVLRTIPE
jgi:hypothetical protein